MTFKRLAVAFIGAGLLLVVGLLLHDVLGERTAEAKAVPAVLRAQQIELVDGNGLVRANLKVERDGQVVFRLMDDRGTIRVKLGADENGSGLLLANESTEPGVHLLATRERSWLSVQRGDRRRLITP
jgi:hypothetical protein